MALTKAERHIIKYPPTEKTWVCQAKRLHDDGTKYICGSILTGTTTRCHWCGAAKPRKPLLLWPTYVAACKKAKIEPTGQPNRL